MKKQFFILLALVTVLGAKAYANGNNPNDQEEKKNKKSKYDFTIFKMFALDADNNESDTTKVQINKSQLKRKED